MNKAEALMLFIAWVVMLLVYDWKVQHIEFIGWVLTLPTLAFILTFLSTGDRKV